MRIFLKGIKPNSYFGQLIKAHPELDPHKSMFLMNMLNDFEKAFLSNARLKDNVFNFVLDHIVQNGSRFSLKSLNLFEPTPEDMKIMVQIYDANISPYWLIPAQVYKAIISRDLAKRQSRMSRGVSLRSLEECAQKIMYNIDVLLVNEDLMEGNDTDLVCDFKTMFPKIRKAFMDFAGEEIASQIAENGRLSQDLSFAFYWYYMISCSLVGPDNPEFPVSNTDRDDTWEKIQNMLNQLPVNPTEDQYIVFINKFIDLCHGRGSLAGAFVEGGAATCSAVSNMEPDELHESMTRRQIKEAIDYWTKVLHSIR